VSAPSSYQVALVRQVVADLLAMQVPPSTELAALSVQVAAP